MKYLYQYTWIVFFALCVSCKNQPKTEPESTVPPATADSVDEKKNYLPVDDILKGELKWVEDYAGAIILKTNSGSRKDSSYIELAKFRQLALGTISSNLDSTYFITHFKEDIVPDAAQEGLTFIYTNQDTGEVRKVMVYVMRTETGDKVNRVYFEKEFNSNNTSIIQRCTWKIHHYVSIVETRDSGNGTPITEVRKAIYDPADFNEQ